jgi:parallel beta-helix repeat protein
MVIVKGIVKKGRIILTTVILCLLLFSYQDAVISPQSIVSDSKIDGSILADYIPHDPFVVDSNYLENNCTGSGTSADPYIIENLCIESNQCCITVRNLDSIQGWGNGTEITTFVHLVIRNCLLVGIPYVWPTGDIDFHGTGVYLFNNAHNVTIINNKFEKLSMGVYCFYLSNNNIIKSNYFNCSYGVRIDDTSTANTICDNTFVGGPDHPNPGTYGCGQHGVGISNSAGNSVVNNTLIGLDSGIDMWVNAMNTTVFNNTITDSFYNGIDLSQSDFVVVANNTCMYNYYFGIWLDQDSTNCTIANNTLALNGHGFEVSITNTSAYGIASSEEGRGIYISRGSLGNRILLNDLIYNQRNALDEVPGNSYGYNFWTDYTGTDSDEDDIGDTPYYVAGAGGGIDEHPRMKSWSPLPTFPTPSSTITPTDNSSSVPVIYLIIGFGITLAAIIVVIIIKRRAA